MRFLPAAALLLIAACDPVSPGPVSVAGGFVAVAAGYEHTCGIAADHSAFCWGDNRAGQLGTGTAGGNVFVPNRVTGAVAFATLSAGAAHTCGLDEGGRLYCWGSNTWGQLGTGTRQVSAAPVAVAPELRFRQISAGGTHSCALAEDGRAFCWGASLHGQSGANGDDVLEPGEVVWDRMFTWISAGDQHSCAIDTDGVLVCWGANGFAQLGDSTQVSRAEPAPIYGGERYIEVAAGYRHTCAIRTVGRAQCWGSNEHGELGEGVAPDPRNPGMPGAYVPYNVQGVQNALGLTAGEYLTCMLGSDVLGTGGTWCWGRGLEGQLGSGAHRDYPVAQRVRSGNPSLDLLNFLAVTAGAQHVCGLNDTRVIFCWGRGDAGQLGAGAIRRSELPVQVLDGP